MKTHQLVSTSRKYFLIVIVIFFTIFILGTLPTKAAPPMSITVSLTQGTKASYYINGGRSGSLKPGQAVDYTSGSIKVLKGKVFLQCKLENNIQGCGNIKTSSGVKNVGDACTLKINGTSKGDLSYKPGKINSALPYIIAPRFSYVSRKTPLLKWNNTGAKSYTVAICDQDGKDLLTETSCGDPKGKKEFFEADIDIVDKQVSLNYPDNTKPLKENTSYLLVVTAKDKDGKFVDSRSEDFDPNKYKASERNGLSELRFKWLNFDRQPENAALPGNVDELIDNIDELIASNLYSDAIHSLESIIDSPLGKFYGEKLIYGKLGELYVSSGLNDLARNSYLHAKEFSSSEQEKVKINRVLCQLDIAISSDSKPKKC
jgi:hypothetical protein